MKYLNSTAQIMVVSLFMFTLLVGNVFSEKFALSKNLGASMQPTVESGAFGIDFCMPVEVLAYRENENGYIEIETYDKTFVKSPFTIKIEIVQKDRMRGVSMEKYGYKCYLMGFGVISVRSGAVVQFEDVIGSLETNKLYVKIYKNENRVSLKTIKALFNA